MHRYFCIVISYLSSKITMACLWHNYILVYSDIHLWCMSACESQYGYADAWAPSATSKITMASCGHRLHHNPVSAQGNRYIVTLSDYFMKYVGATPLPTKCATGVAKVLFKVILEFCLNANEYKYSKYTFHIAVYLSMPLHLHADGNPSSYDLRYWNWVKKELDRELMK